MLTYQLHGIFFLMKLLSYSDHKNIMQFYESFMFCHLGPHI